MAVIITVTIVGPQSLHPFIETVAAMAFFAGRFHRPKKTAASNLGSIVKFHKITTSERTLLVAEDTLAGAGVLGRDPYAGSHC
jgi:hypothetical protein